MEAGREAGTSKVSATDELDNAITCPKNDDEAFAHILPIHDPGKLKLTAMLCTLIVDAANASQQDELRLRCRAIRTLLRSDSDGEPMRSCKADCVSLSCALSTCNHRWRLQLQPF